ncbi:hypothetical protein SMQE31_05570 [Serratia marcescens]|nr:hypothetical protein SMQE31_05570 [Serratia marcescens]
MNKLSELSKPVAWKLHHHDRYYFEENADVVAIAESMGQAKGDAVYSQEYVFALLAELEAKDEALRELAFRVSAGGYNADSVDAEEFKQKIIDGINSISAVLIKRIDELEAVKADASQVFKEIGNELGCNPDNESIMMAIDALKERLATPVRLPLLYSPDPWMSPDPDGTWLDKEDVKKSIRAAGFTVEGDA